MRTGLAALGPPFPGREVAVTQQQRPRVQRRAQTVGDNLLGSSAETASITAWVPTSISIISRTFLDAATPRRPRVGTNTVSLAALAATSSWVPSQDTAVTRPGTPPVSSAWSEAYADGRTIPAAGPRQPWRACVRADDDSAGPAAPPEWTNSRHTPRHPTRLNRDDPEDEQHRHPGRRPPYPLLHPTRVSPKLLKGRLDLGGFNVLRELHHATSQPCPTHPRTRHLAATMLSFPALLPNPGRICCRLHPPINDSRTMGQFMGPLSRTPSPLQVSPKDRCPETESNSTMPEKESSPASCSGSCNKPIGHTESVPEPFDATSQRRKEHRTLKAADEIFERPKQISSLDC